MRNTLATGLGLAAILAAGTALAADITTDVNRLGVSSDGQLIERPTLAQRLVDATNDMSTGSGDDDDGDDHDHDDDAADDDTGGDSKGCGCATSTASGYGALAVLLPLGLVGLRRRQD